MRFGPVVTIDTAGEFLGTFGVPLGRMRVGVTGACRIDNG
jgi:hypothetical protein